MAASFSFCSNSQKLMILMIMIKEDDRVGSIKTFGSYPSTTLRSLWKMRFLRDKCRFDKKIIYDGEVSLDGVQDPSVFMSEVNETHQNEIWDLTVLSDFSSSSTYVVLFRSQRIVRTKTVPDFCHWVSDRFFG